MQLRIARLITAGRNLNIHILRLPKDVSCPGDARKRATEGRGATALNNIVGK
jgi:hypothetical protein